jgi:hypothetical protein
VIRISLVAATVLMHEPVALLRLPRGHEPPQVIPGPVNERIVFADDLEALVPKLSINGRERHLVRVLCFGRAGGAIHNDQAAARPKRAKYTIKDQLRIPEFVIGVTDQHRVYNICRQTRIIFFADNDLNIVLASQ